MPFTVTVPGDYNFRIHADYGSGSFMGVDGAEYTPGDLWGHALVDATSLTAGVHEFDVLGFEPCCDGHAEMELHLPCDGPNDAWRTVVKGASECMACDDELEQAPASCSMDTDSAGCCGSSGGHVLCHPTLEDGTCDPSASMEDATNMIGRFIAVGESMSYPQAMEYCNTHYAGIASIHSPAEQGHARSACMKFADGSGEVGSTNGCWIGLGDDSRGADGYGPNAGQGVSGGFRWADGSPVDYVAWAHGEPNGWNGATLEDESAMLFSTVQGYDGHWNDVDGSDELNAYCNDESQWNNGQGGREDDGVSDEDRRNWCKYGGMYGLFPLCQLQRPPPAAPGAPMVWGTGVTSSFRIQICVDHVDTLFFRARPPPPSLAASSADSRCRRRAVQRTTASGCSMAGNTLRLGRTRRAPSATSVGHT